MRILSIFLLLLAGLFTEAQKKSKLAVPKLKDGKYYITIKNSTIEVNPDLGARITSLSLNGVDFLTGPDINPKYWGSSFWLSPQKDWNDFSHELDNKSYPASIENNVIKMLTEKDPKTGLIFSREISGSLNTGFFTIKYGITNASSEPRKLAPWEVTRVNVNGLAFFPRGEAERFGSMAAMVEDLEGINWFKHEADKIPPKHLKLFSDGKEGWVAQVNGNKIFIKKFPDVSLTKVAPGEAEVEIYTNQDRTYVEIEEQGAYESLQPGTSMSWEVSWYIGQLPSNIESVKGNPALPAYVRKLVKAGSH